MSKYIRMKIETFETPWEERNVQGYQKEENKSELMDVVVPLDETWKLSALLNTLVQPVPLLLVPKDTEVIK